MPGAHRSRRMSTSDNYDDLLVEIETLRTQLNTTSSNLSTLRGTNNRLNDRIAKLETTIEDQTIKSNEQDRDFISLRRQIRISGSEITRLRSEKEVLEREFEDLNTNLHDDKDNRQDLMDKVAELEEQLASALHLHVMAENRGALGNVVEGVTGVQDMKAMSWTDLKAKLREAEDELDAVQQERDWLEGQLEKMIHSKDAVGGSELDVGLLKPLRNMASMSSFRSNTSRATTASNATSRGRPSNRGEALSLGAELGNMEWNGSDDDEENDSDATEQADGSDNDGELSPNGLQVPKITKTLDDDALSISSSKRDLKDFALRLDTSGQPYRPTSSFSSSQRAPSIAPSIASFRSRMSTRSRRSPTIHNLDAAPGAPVATTAVFHEIERKHEEKVSKLQNDIVSLSMDLQGEIEILQEEVDAARAERDTVILELQRVTTEMGLVKARHEDAEAMRTISRAPSMVSLRSIASNHTITPPEMERSMDKAHEAVQAFIPTARLPTPPLAPVAIVETPKIISRQTSIATIRSPSPQPSIATRLDSLQVPINKALEEEVLALQQKEQDRLAEMLGLRSEIDKLTRNLREKDALLRAEVVSLERDLDELKRENRNMRDDAEIEHFKVENLADELDRTRELLQLQAEERREFMEEIERLQARIRELENQSRQRGLSRSPTQLSNPHSPTPAESPFAMPAESPFAMPAEVTSEKSIEVAFEKPTEAIFEKPAEVIFEEPAEVTFDKPAEVHFAIPAPAPTHKPNSFGSRDTSTSRGTMSTKTDSDMRAILAESSLEFSDSESDAHPDSPVARKRRHSSAASKSGGHHHSRKHSYKKDRKERDSSTHKRSQSSSKTRKERESVVSRKINTPELSPIDSPISPLSPLEPLGLEYESEPEVPPPPPRTRPRKPSLLPVFSPTESPIPPVKQVKEPVYQQPQYVPSYQESRSPTATRTRSRKASLLPVYQPTERIPTPVQRGFESPEPEDYNAHPSMAMTSRPRPSNIPSLLPRPTKSRSQTAPLPAPQTEQDKTYFKDLMVGGYALPPHEYNKYRRQARRTNLSMHIKVTSHGIESSSRVGTGSLIGVGGYADEVEDPRRASLRRTSGRRKESVLSYNGPKYDMDEEDHDNAQAQSWLGAFFRK